MLESLKRNEINAPLMGDLDSQLAAAVEKEMNIYNQAFLIEHTPLIHTEVFHKKTSQEVPLSFELEGELNGFILCYLEADPEIINNKNYPFFQSLYIESMNIALGQFFTNLEKNSSLLTTISHPDINMKKIEMIEKFENKFRKYTWNYKLVSQMRELNCRIIFLLK